MDFTGNNDVFWVQLDAVATGKERIVPDDKHIIPWSKKQVHATLSNIY